MNAIFSKYKLVLLPLLLVMLFDVSLLAMNYYIASQLDATSTNINIAGRQRMLSQKITKAIVVIHYQIHNNNEIDMAELRTATELFEQTLTAFSEGGEATSAAGIKIQIDKLSESNVSAMLLNAKHIWQPLYKQIGLFFTSPLSEQGTDQLVEALMKDNNKLLALMNDLTNSLENEAKKNTYFLRGLQTLVVFMILISFFVATIRLYRRENYYDNLMEKSTDIIVSVDVRTALTTFVSSSVFGLLGYSEKHYLTKPVSLFFVKESKAVFSEILETAYKTGALVTDRCKVKLLRNDGSIVIADIVMQLVLSENGKAMEVTADIRDISDRKAAEIALVELAHKDTLTGLPNRTLFYDLAEHSINIAKRRKTGIAVMFIDLDGFKAVNDKFGHDIGDGVLVETASRITSCLRESDSVSRIGGDEFIVLLEDVITEASIADVAKQIVNAVSKVIVINECHCEIGASIGISRYPNNGTGIEILMKKADSAMYKVKSTGKNNISFSE
jgi:diguanylate cyclase (GGDEF)-like protein/PAS domain S-box-containing protein